MTDVLLMGAGKIGAMIAEMLVSSGDYQVTVADFDEDNLNQIPDKEGILKRQLDATNEAELLSALEGKFAVLSACPYAITSLIAKAAHKAKVHYMDLTEDVNCTRLVKELADTAESALIPQCGLAPGFISIVAYDLAKRFDTLHDVHMRVGALPRFPSNALKYNLTWSTDGLVNEYCNPCEAIVDGQLIEVPPLEELETIIVDGVEYEAFNTSGGLGTLCETLDGKVHNLNYRTARYPGHRDILKLLIKDLRMGERREMLKEMFEFALPTTKQDVVLIYVTVNGYKDGQFIQESYANKIFSREMDGKVWTAIQITTASGICAVVDLLREGLLPMKGFVRQEQIQFSDFIMNRFGANYALSE